MKKMLVTTFAALSMLASSSYAQLDLGGAISGAINQATGGGAQVGAQTGAQVGGQAGQLGLPGASLGTQAGAQLGGQLGSQIGGAAAGQTGANIGGNIGARAGANLGTNIGGGTQGTQGNLGVAGGLNAGAQAGTNQSWLGRVGNDLRSALQPGANGNMQLQGNVNQSLQQYGFRAGDQLLDANGQPLRQDQVDYYLQNSPNQVRVLRNGQTVVLDGNMRAYGQSNYAQGGVRATGRQRFGITMSPTTNAVIVSSVTQGSPAATAGLRSGDQIVAINGQAVNTPNDMIQLVGQADANAAMDVEYRRNGQSMHSQVMLAGTTNADVRQAGFNETQGRSNVQGSASADVNSRIDRLEQMIEELRAEVRRLAPAGGSDSQQ